MMLTLYTFIALLVATFALTSAQTLYRVSENVPSQTVVGEIDLSLSAGGTNADGATTYIAVVAASSLLQLKPSTTVNLIPPGAPTTWSADASGETRMVGDVVESCGLGADGRGTCVERVAAPSRTVTFTVSGSVVPFYTLPAKSSAAVVRFTPWSMRAVVLVSVCASGVLLSNAKGRGEMYKLREGAGRMRSSGGMYAGRILELQAI
ncbi:hypothetical protein DFH06DRAFT_1377182 [Mycena polygramma]|nr:hypothetical protein DFH06DRAFT_1377182 [Mycena polygramma]